jgi:hypothetical protein
VQPGPEALLVAVLVGLYIYDAGVWLYGNEAVLTVTTRGVWKAGFARRFGTWRGRQLYFPNFVAPWRPAFKLVWQYSSPTRSQHESWTDYTQPLGYLGPLVASLFVVLFVVLPPIVLARQGELTVLGLFVVVYLHVIAICGLLWKDRHRLKLTSRQFAALAFELLLCPPFAVNVVRRLSLSMPVGEDFSLASARLLSPERLRAVQGEMLLRLDDEIAAEAEDSERMRTLVQRKALLDQACRQ